jgi:hypothetical protein
MDGWNNTWWAVQITELTMQFSPASCCFTPQAQRLDIIFQKMHIERQRKANWLTSFPYFRWPRGRRCALCLFSYITFDFVPEISDEQVRVQMSSQVWDTRFMWSSYERNFVAWWFILRHFFSKETTQSRWQDDEWRLIGMDFVGSGRGLILRYYSGISMEGLRKTIKTSSE